MTEVLKIRHKLWNGSINVRIEFDDGSPEPKEYLLTVPRVSYLPIHFKDMVLYFRNFGPVQEPIWLEYNGIPLKWNLPVGVLYDYYHLPKILDRRHQLPILELTVRSGSKWPGDLIPFDYKGEIDYEKTMCDNFFNQLKQSSFVANGNSKLVMNLSKDNSTRLWQSIVSHDLNEYENLNKKILPKRVSKFPIKIYLPGTPIIQLPIALNDEFGHILDQFPGFDAYIHGIQVNNIRSLEIAELWRVFRHSDNFLYIVMV
ncbi:autophagy protein 5 [Yamadazyma tenuis]|uniref:Autophagy protein 5 n=1 Tax=Candida tenuis (strain ATCC 10573 / BCRC 21748 / CBS 615 / JCM 9827 / NBRC 10315 / NRRL Y-1498 / VKM Y-70) TaxID=590646 RepID=G3B7B2_CANTC|nr:uncharacterized protein CANTEDRAFT_98806 [Yamadazyma tenuis ATCC 10573]EGV61613.1 hypothetical protein CANTEDRAFT_98806 [Yamadazyma tenuis ATCC 10573]WEJ92834.1 autophagy protein 5 [Yamadazyma tenuis]